MTDRINNRNWTSDNATRATAVAVAVAVPTPTAAQAALATLRSNTVLRNTYWLLALTLMFGGGIAAATAAAQLPHPGLMISLGGYFGLFYLTWRLRDSAWGLASVFALTGFMGYTLGPVIARTLTLPDGHALVAMSLGGTGLIFAGLSAYVLTTRRDFSFLGGFLMVGILTAFVGGLTAIFFDFPALQMAVSAAFVLLMSGFILWQTSAIVEGGETNYIMATVGLYVSIHNLVSSLLALFGMGSSSD